MTLVSEPAANIGVGDEVRETNARYYITGRNSSTQFTIQDSAADSGTPGDTNIDFSETPITIYRAFNTLTAAEAESGNSARMDTENLKGENYQLNLTCYNDAEMDDGEIDVYGYTTAPTNYIRIYTPVTKDEVGASQRHTGSAGTGFRLKPTAAPSSAYYEILDIDNAYVRVEGIEIDGTNVDMSSSQYLYGIMLSGAGDMVVDRVIIHDLANVDRGAGTSCGAMGIYHDDDGSSRISNSIIYDITNNAQHTPSYTYGIRSGSNFDQYIYNNTIFDIESTHASCDSTVRGIYRAQGYQIVKNNYIGKLATAGGGGTLCYYSGMTMGSNVASDTSGDIDSKTDYTSYFLSTTNGSEDFHLREDTNTLDWGSYGEDLTSDPVLSVLYDIDGEDRNASQLDIGADQFGPLAGSVMIVSKLYLDHLQTIVSSKLDKVRALWSLFQ